MDVIEKLIALEKYLQDQPLGVRILDEIPDACVIVDGRDKTIVFMNKGAEILFGYYRGELYGIDMHVLVPEALREKHEEHVNGYMLSPHRRSMGIGLVTPGLKKDGTTFAAEISLSPIIVPNGFFIIATIRVAR